MADPYASHLAVLAALDPPPKKVLEFGGGDYSTKAFLEMEGVNRVVTIETDPTWRKKLEKIKDARLEVLDGSKVPALSNFDLVFIDDGSWPQQRMETIVRVLSQPHPRVVIHDADYTPYVQTIADITDDFVVHADAVPHTAVVAATRGKKK